MSSYQGTRLYVLFISIVYLFYGLAPPPRGGSIPWNATTWLTGYKLIFFAAAVKSAAVYVCAELNTVLERTRRLQCSALSTTSKGEVFALCREERLRCDSDIGASAAAPGHSKGAFGHIGEQQQQQQQQQLLFLAYDRYNPAPVFWCTLTAFAVLYNTAHLALAPYSDTLPLLFGAPAYVLYWGAMRTIQMMLR